MRRALGAALLVGCLPDGPDCAGSGAGSIVLGAPTEPFAPWVDGDPIPVDTLGGELGFEVAVRAVGLDTRAPVVVTASVAAGDEAPRGAFVEAALTCRPHGESSMRLWLPLAPVDQSHGAAAALDGAPLAVEITVDDAGLDGATDEVVLTIDASALTSR